MNKLLKNFIPIRFTQCTECNGYSIRVILLNGKHVCHRCYNRKYIKSFHLV